jgi:hypothetical protein
MYVEAFKGRGGGALCMGDQPIAIEFIAVSIHPVNSGAADEINMVNEVGIYASVIRHSFPGPGNGIAFLRFEIIFTVFVASGTRVILFHECVIPIPDGIPEDLECVVAAPVYFLHHITAIVIGIQQHVSFQKMIRFYQSFAVQADAVDIPWNPSLVNALIQDQAWFVSIYVGVYVTGAVSRSEAVDHVIVVIVIGVRIQRRGEGHIRFGLGFYHILMVTYDRGGGSALLLTGNQPGQKNKA